MNSLKAAFALLLTACSLLFQGCGSSNKPSLKVVASAVPHAEMLEFVKEDLQKQGITLEILVTDDYNMPNRAVAHSEADANFFQHIPFLNEQNRQFNDSLISLGAIEIEPMGVYSKKIRSLNELQDGAVVAIPNDPTNEARALLLLQTENLIEVNRNKGQAAMVLDITSNPKLLQFIEVDAAMLPRALDDVDVAVINTNYALGAGLSPQTDAIALESSDSPYANVLVIRKGDENRPDLIALKNALTSEKMRHFIVETYQGAVQPAF
jgi:D-methionine transport system substrate-binding protein